MVFCVVNIARGLISVGAVPDHVDPVYSRSLIYFSEGLRS